MKSDLKTRAADAETESVLLQALLGVVIILQGAMFVRLVMTWPRLSFGRY